MARPATGAPLWNPAKKVWEARITMPGKGRQPFPMPEIRPCLVSPDRPVPKCTCASCARAKRVAKLLSDRARRDGIVPSDCAETVNEWFGRLFDWKASRKKGSETAEEARGRFEKWTPEELGTTAMVRVTREQLERYAAYLDEQVNDDVISWKTAANIWGELVAGFNIATRGGNKYGKNLELRILKSNPADGAAGPDSGDEKQKPFLRPDEITKLLSCEAIPLERRHVYAVAIYTAMRQGELRALQVRDIDLDAMQISIVRQVKSGVEKQRTKNGHARIIQIEPNLVPLLKVLMEGKEGTDRVLSVGAHNRCASNLREDLILAECKREALHVPKTDPLRVHIKFHNLKDTCGTHMAVRRDPPQDIQWRLAHSDLKTTEIYIGRARYEAGPSFGVPLGPLPVEVLRPPPPEGATGFWQGIGILDRKRPKKPGKLVEAPGIEVSRTRPHASEEDRASSEETAANVHGVPTSVPTVLEGCERPQQATPDVAIQTAAGVDEDALEGALAAALNEAAKAGRFDVVAQLARQLDERKAARAVVVRLDAHRKRRAHG